MIAAIRIRGTANVTAKLRTTLEMLRLFKSNHLVLVNEANGGRKMVEKVKDYVTFGEIDQKTLAVLLERRGRLYGNRKITLEALKEKKVPGFLELAKSVLSDRRKIKELGIAPVFRLHPPRKGHERAGIKKSYKEGGALGNRGPEINELIIRMS
ncbi:MAG: 50S ribosomal protein L30 [Candidatus Diapherotrites archaeon]|uniref:Large ribosomal subunit protein uL30 n=1 Tax=Candidatus Iainarchaeum sp. TaxID=3101447 RepID=A0A8T3YHY1_9ARCH|nr:50S ribosomal protein L30 [Candidatus Diapherotrites archaeon]